MTLTQLQYVVAIAETKSMNKAAAALFVSQPALSGAIKDLEGGFQTELFIRTNKGNRDHNRRPGYCKPRKADG